MKLSKTQFRTVNNLVTSECASYMQGKCISLDIICPQVSCRTGLCSYLKKCVLPLDGYLYCEVVKDGERFTKRCEKCGCIFESKAKNTRFCEECAKKQTRFNKKKYMQVVRTKVG